MSDYEWIISNRKYDTYLVSIVIPTYKRGDLLIEAINSAIESVLSDDDFEIIVVSNDPEDNLENLAKKYSEINNFSIAKNTINLGMCGNINQCYKIALGKYVAYLHDDDLLLKSYCSTIKKYLNENVYCIIPSRKVVFSHDAWGRSMKRKQNVKKMIKYFVIPPKIKKIKLVHPSINDVILSGRNIFNAPTCGTIYKKQMLIDINGFDNKWTYAFDLMLYEKMYKLGYQAQLLNEYLGEYRMLQSASNNGKVQLEFFEALKYILDEYHSKSSNKYYYEYLFLFMKGLSNETQKLILDKYSNEFLNVSKLKYFKLRYETQMYFWKNGYDIVK